MRLAVLILAVCLGLGVVETVQLLVGVDEFAEPGLGTALSRALPSWLLLAGLSPVAVWTSSRWPVRDPAWLRAVAVHVAISFPFAVAHLMLSAAWGIVRPGAAVTGFTDAFVWLATRYTVYGMMSYGAIVGVVHAWRYYREAAAREGEASVLLSELERARLKAVEGKLHPHFALNTLNAITGLATRGDRRGVVRTLDAFGDLLRAALEDRAVDIVPLRDELELLASYVAIQRVRFGDRVRIVHDIEPSVMNALVPGMLLQPLVENALVHGVGRDREGGWIRVEAAEMDDGVCIRVRDSGPGSSGSARRSSGHGIGLDGTRARIRSLFGPEARLELVPSNDGGTEVVVSLPRVPVGS